MGNYSLRNDMIGKCLTNQDLNMFTEDMMWTYYSSYEFETCLVLEAKPSNFHYKTTLLRPCGQVVVTERYDSELFISPDGVARTYGEFL